MSKEAMKLALEAVGKAYDELACAIRDKTSYGDAYVELGMAHHYLKQAIAEAKQEQGEPVAKYSDIVSDGGFDPRNKFDTTPQQRTWVALTLEERDHLWGVSRAGLPRYNTFAGLVESKLREKNT